MCGDCWVWSFAVCLQACWSILCLSGHSFLLFVGESTAALGREGNLLPYDFSLYVILRAQCIFFLKLKICLTFQQICFRVLFPALLLLVSVNAHSNPHLF